MNASRCFALAALLSVPAPALADDFPKFEDKRLQTGREVWLGTCEACHNADFAGAPRITDREAWLPRAAKGKAVLYEHALKGFHGPKGTEMPPRGGNDKLTDEEVKAAVDYMVRVATGQ